MDNLPIRLPNPLAADSIPELIVYLINALITLGIIILPIIILWGGIMFLTSAGDPNKVQRAKQILTWSILGFVIMLLSKAGAEFVISIFQNPLPI
ncbi:MAG: hypothetical protein HYV77_02660 [Candidatus Wildermuthbacteria bacterium]|nr:hypothetical protein [Candidatus Wildermuthbacteria bacterium]